MQVSTVCTKVRQKIGVMYHKFYHASTPILYYNFIKHAFGRTWNMLHQSGTLINLVL